MAEQPTPIPENALDELEQVLHRQARLHTQMIRLLSLKRDAVAQADGNRLEALCREENVVLQQLGELEKQRIAVVGTISAVVAPTRTDPLSLREIAARSGPERGAILSGLLDEARSRMEHIRTVSSVLHSAVEALSAHLAGVMQTVLGTLSQARVYERHGRLSTGTQVVSTLDLTS